MVNQYKPVPDLPAEPTPGLADLALIVHGGAVVLATLANILALRRARVLDGNYGAITVTGDGTVWDLTEDILKLLGTFLGTAGGTIPVWDRSGPAWRDLVIGANLAFDGTTLSATGGTATPPAGSDAQLQFNDGGAFGGAALVRWRKFAKDMLFGTGTDSDSIAIAFLGAGFGWGINIGGNGFTIGQAGDQKLGFWGNAPVTRPHATGSTAGFVQNASANDVFAESTFSGGFGSALYTIDDIVLALKTCGLLATDNPP